MTPKDIIKQFNSNVSDKCRGRTLMNNFKCN